MLFLFLYFRLTQILMIVNNLRLVVIKQGLRIYDLDSEITYLSFKKIMEKLIDASIDVEFYTFY